MSFRRLLGAATAVVMLGSLTALPASAAPARSGIGSTGPQAEALAAP